MKLPWLQKRTQEVDDFALNHLTFTNDYHRISIYTINTTSSRQIPDSPNQHHENYIANSKENYWWDLGSERVTHNFLPPYVGPLKPTKYLLCFPLFIALKQNLKHIWHQTKQSFLVKPLLVIISKINTKFWKEVQYIHNIL